MSHAPNFGRDITLYNHVTYMYRVNCSIGKQTAFLEIKNDFELLYDGKFMNDLSLYFIFLDILEIEDFFFQNTHMVQTPFPS